jgi:hypothetical protein
MAARWRRANRHRYTSTQGIGNWLFSDDQLMGKSLSQASPEIGAVGP